MKGVEALEVGGGRGWEKLEFTPHLRRAHTPNPLVDFAPLARGTGCVSNLDELLTVSAKFFDIFFFIIGCGLPAGRAVMWGRGREQRS